MTPTDHTLMLPAGQAEVDWKRSLPHILQVGTSPRAGRLRVLPASLLAVVESRRLRISLALAAALHCLPLVGTLSWPASLALAEDSALVEIDTTTLSSRPGSAEEAPESAAERAAEEARAAEQARAAAEAKAAAEAAERERAAQEAAERAAAEQAAAEQAAAERAAQELAAQIRALPIVDGQELTPRPPTAGPVERSVTGDPSLVREEAAEQGGEGPPAGSGPGTLTAKFCEISPHTRWIAEIVECSSGPERHFEHLNVPPREFREGYPGFEDTGRIEFFALFIRGSFDVTQSGVHHFRLTADDGAQLFIDEQLVVDNDGLHPPITRHGSAELSAGRHQLRIVFFQSIRETLALQLFVTPPGQDERVFSTRL